MMRYSVCCVGSLCLSLVACVEAEISRDEQAAVVTQGTPLQGTPLQGISLSGTTMQGFLFDGAALNGLGLTNVRVEKGELVAEQGAATVRGTALNGTQLRAQVQDLNVS